MSRPVFTGSYQFLTTKPATRRFSKINKEWLYILPMADMNSANLYYKMYFDDDTNSTGSISLGNLRDDEAKIVDISYALVDYDSIITSPATRIKKIEVYVGTASSEDSGDKITLIPYTPQGEVLALYYANSYGGFDSLICTGANSQNLISEQEVTKRIMTHSEDINTTAQYKVVDAMARSSYTINTAFMPLGEVKALRDLSIKKPIRMMKEIDGVTTMVPYILEPNSLSMPSTFTPNTNFSFVITEAMDNHAFEAI